MKKFLVAAVLAGVFAFGATEAQAQVAIGAQVNYANEMDFGVGVRAGMALPFTGLSAVASFDYYFPDLDNFTYFELNGNVLYDIPLVGVTGFAPYVGGGLNIARSKFEWEGVSVPGIVEIPGGSESNTELGLNIVGGANFNLAVIRPFAELRYQIHGGDFENQFVIAAGVTF